MQKPALYYPYIHIRDEQWLKTAALYWPSVYSMVPAGYRRKDSPTAARFYDADVLRTVDPWEFTAGTELDLNGALRDNSDDLVRHFSIERAIADFDGVPFGEVGPEEEPALGWIHLTKFPPRFLDRLCRMGLARRGRAELPGKATHGGSGIADWIGLHPTLAGASMTVLARQ
jgi:hypothetical protein